MGYYGESGRLGVVTMGYNFLPWDHHQPYLLPPDLREWLPADHEVWALLEAAGLLDFSAFFARRRADGWGRAAYHPAMMALLLLYAYAQGERYRGPGVSGQGRPL